ncbi:DUF1990 family protein [Pseudarthrobacter enclensis]|uniref:DUF1990 family protein n=1 Tax=Pseudarthrobacter enclensis TaxID=993070 RepID=UPI0036CAA0B8
MLREHWTAVDGRYRRSEVSAFVGTGPTVWARAAEEVLSWKVKTESGFAVESRGRVSPGQRVTVTARPCGVPVVEPVEVTDVVREADRVGFSYRTLPGHPVDGEEAFILCRHGEDVHLYVRSLTRPASQQPWRLLFPALLVAQRIVRRRYLRSLPASTPRTSKPPHQNWKARQRRADVAPVHALKQPPSTRHRIRGLLQ